MQKYKKLVPAFVALALVGLAGGGAGVPIAAAQEGHPSDAFLRIDGIPGESAAVGHEDEIDIQSWSFGESSSLAGKGGGGGGGAGKVMFQDFHFSAFYGKQSPLLFQAVPTGQHFPSAVLTLERPGEGDSFPYLVVTLTDVVIMSYQTGGSGNERPMDSFSMNYATVEWDYAQQGVDGEGEHTRRGWDLRRNRPIG